MTLHNKPYANTPEIIAGLKAHGMEVDTPSMLADAFRSGRLSAAPTGSRNAVANAHANLAAQTVTGLKEGRSDDDSKGTNSSNSIGCYGAGRTAHTVSGEYDPHTTPSRYG